MQEHQHFKNYYIESRSFAGRVLLTALVIVGLTSLLLYRYYNLQIIHHEDYATQSDNNRILVQTITPQRGLIFDTSGRLLADNRPSYILSLVPENIKSIDETIESLRTLINVNEDHVQDFYKSLKTNRRPYQPIPLRFRLTEEEIARIAVNEYRLDGVEDLMFFCWVLDVLFD